MSAEISASATARTIHTNPGSRLATSATLLTAPMPMTRRGGNELVPCTSASTTAHTQNAVATSSPLGFTEPARSTASGVSPTNRPAASTGGRRHIENSTYAPDARKAEHSTAFTNRIRSQPVWSGNANDGQPTNV